MLELGDSRHPRFVFPSLSSYQLVFALFISFCSLVYIIAHSRVRYSTKLYCLSVSCSHKLNESINSFPCARPATTRIPCVCGKNIFCTSHGSVRNTPFRKEVLLGPTMVFISINYIDPQQFPAYFHKLKHIAYLACRISIIQGKSHSIFDLTSL